MSWKHIVIAVMLFLLICAAYAIMLLWNPLLAYAADTVTTSWSYTEEEQATITEFRIYNGDHNLVVGEIPVTAREQVFDAPAVCTGYYIVAYKAGYTQEDGTEVPEVESDPSNIVAYCPEADTIPAPLTFNVVGTVTLEATP
jgi:hypothetical protein